MKVLKNLSSYKVISLILFMLMLVVCFIDYYFTAVKGLGPVLLLLFVSLFFYFRDSESQIIIKSLKSKLPLTFFWAGFSAVLLGMGYGINLRILPVVLYCLGTFVVFFAVCRTVGEIWEKNNFKSLWGFDVLCSGGILSYLFYYDSYSIVCSLGIILALCVSIKTAKIKPLMSFGAQLLTLLFATIIGYSGMNGFLDFNDNIAVVFLLPLISFTSVKFTKIDSDFKNHTVSIFTYIISIFLAGFLLNKHDLGAIVLFVAAVLSGGYAQYRFYNNELKGELVHTATVTWMLRSFVLIQLSSFLSERLGWGRFVLFYYLIFEIFVYFEDRLVKRSAL